MTRASQSLRYRFLKRAFDIASSLAVAAAAVLLWPLSLPLLGVIAVQSKASPFYAQERIGRGGRPFRLLKLRTMLGDADDAAKHLDAAQMAQWERERKVDGDPRVTPAGKALRKASLDELPQFLNVLAGRMSVVGPRPIVADELANFTDAERAELLSVRPGITGWWQVTDRNEATWEDGSRQEPELYYVRNAGLRLDAEVLARTVGVMFGRRKTGR